MKLFKIRNRITGGVIFEKDADSMSLVVEAAVPSNADLRDADLRDADLRGARISGADLRGANLRGADLRGAYLISADLRGADLGGADLRGAYLCGVDLGGAYLRDADLRGADLRHSDLRGAYLCSADLRDADLRDADLRDARLRGSDLRGVDLGGAYLGGADLSGAYLSGADLRDLGGIPSIENIHQKIYAAASQQDALNMSDWHTCDSTHCRAGWAVHLAGEAGAALEYGLGTSVAAALIYLKSDTTLERIPDFHCNNDEALADMKAMAKKETALQSTKQEKP